MIQRCLTKNRNKLGNVVEYIRGRGGTCEVSRDKRARVSPVTSSYYIVKKPIKEYLEFHDLPSPLCILMP